MGFGMIGGMLLFWIVLIGLAVLLVRGFFQPGSLRTTGHPQSASDVLKARYARGEITKEQYELILKDIQE